MEAAKIIEELLQEAVDYTSDLACCFCDGELGEDEEGNETEIEHTADCVTLRAAAWLECFYSAKTAGGTPAPAEGAESEETT